ncbi:LytTR family DNA-binding domain-containing protein [Mammaliicoccus sciuri]|uniref:Accessory gene regulator protein A n=1 Tax=Sporosarcina newyorkensis 2681 TaxID=1027292 RepID=F9DSD2_9BACL|nr:LytTR family DNA-binding domain-containing protein [Sporosarcina newyorkensis]EGQ26269.1 accessory gene regulator protein A [Sporosarcina newyorkensis 2681]
MRVIICEDNPVQKEFIYKEIMNYASFHEPSIEVVLCTSTPDDVLTYLDHYQADCYFLDIELDHQLDGMDLAVTIRKRDPLATIIFITTHADRLKLTFTYKLAALDFIVKDTPNQIAAQVKEALESAFEKYTQLGEVDSSEVIQIKIGERIKNIRLQDIYYFETSAIPHKITVYEKNGYYEFYGRLKDFEEVSSSFYRCHKSLLINLQHVNELDKKKRTVTMTNGAICDISFRASGELQRRIRD